jgi:hypothetical protein
MRAAVLAAAVVAFFSSLASAVVTVRPADQVPRPGGVSPIVIYADPITLDFNQNERLNAFTMTVEAPGFGPPGGNRPWFVIPPPDPAGYYRFDLPQDAGHQYVFGNTPSTSPYDPTGMSTYNIVFLAAALDSPAQGVDITATRNGFAQLYVYWPAGAPFGVYTIRVGNDFLSLGGDDGTIEAIGGTGTFAVIPEPAVVGLAAAMSLFLLRRRRPA